MIFNEIKCRVNTSLGLVGGDASPAPPLCPRLSDVLFHTLYVTIPDSQRHKKRMLIVIHFHFSCSFFYSRGGQIATWGPHVARQSVFSGCGSIQENLRIWNILQLITVNVSAEANLNRDLFQFSLEGTALRCTRPSESGPRAKLITHPCSIEIFC